MRTPEKGEEMIVVSTFNKGKILPCVVESVDSRYIHILINKLNLQLRFDVETRKQVANYGVRYRLFDNKQLYEETEKRYNLSCRIRSQLLGKGVLADMSIEDLIMIDTVISGILNKYTGDKSK